MFCGYTIICGHPSREFSCISQRQSLQFPQLFSDWACFRQFPWWFDFTIQMSSESIESKIFGNHFASIPNQDASEISKKIFRCDFWLVNMTPFKNRLLHPHRPKLVDISHRNTKTIRLQPEAKSCFRNDNSWWRGRAQSFSWILMQMRSIVQLININRGSGFDHMTGDYLKNQQNCSEFRARCARTNKWRNEWNAMNEMTTKWKIRRN